MKSKTLAICSIVFALLIAIVGLILGLIGVYKYENKSTGWILSLVGVILAAANMIITATLI
jgi:hypothetical membrane protein